MLQIKNLVYRYLIYQIKFRANRWKLLFWYCRFYYNKSRVLNCTIKKPHKMLSKNEIYEFTKEQKLNYSLYSLVNLIYKKITISYIPK